MAKQLRTVATEQGEVFNLMFDTKTLESSSVFIGYIQYMHTTKTWNAAPISNGYLRESSWYEFRDRQEAVNFLRQQAHFK